MEVLSKYTGIDVGTKRNFVSAPFKEDSPTTPRETFTPGELPDNTLIKPTLKTLRKPKSSRVDKMLDTAASPEAGFTLAVGAIFLTALAALLRPKN